MATWEKRRVGRTNLHVTSLGLGTATMGGSRIQLTNEERLKLVNAAWDAGVRYVDTAPFYGVGAAERAAGDALRDRPREEWVLSTKVGRLLRPHDSGGSAPMAGWCRCRSRCNTTTRTTASCARWRTAISAWAWPRSTSCSCTTSASISTARRRTPRT